MPDSARPIAKAIVALVLSVVGVLVAVGLLDVELGKKITTEVIAFAAALGIVVSGGVYGTRNEPGIHRNRR